MFKNRFPVLHEKLSHFLNMMIVCFAFVMPINPMLVKKLVGMMLLVWIFSVDYRRLFELLRYNRIFQTLLLLIGFVTLSLLWSDDIDAGINYLRFYYKFFLVIVVIVAASLRREYIKPLISAFLLAMCLNELMSYAIFFEMTDNFFGYTVHGTRMNPIPYQEHHIVYSLLVAFTVFLMLYQFFTSQYRYLKPLLLLFAITMTANLFLSIGRTGQVALIFTTLMIIVIYYRTNIKLILGTFAALALTFILAYQFSQSFHLRVNTALVDIQKVWEQKNYFSSWGNRLFAYKVVPDILDDSSYLFGAGIGDMGELVNKHYISNGWPEKHASIYGIGILHNSFLSITASTGLIGLAIFCYLLYRLLEERYSDRYLSYLRYCLLGMLFISSFSSEFFAFRGLGYFFALFIALLIAQKRYEELEPAESDSIESRFVKS